MNIRKEVLGDKHPDYAESLNNLAAFYVSTGQSQQALPLYREALQIREEALGKKHPHYAQSLHNLAGVCESLGDYAAALTLHQQSAEICRVSLGDKHPEYAGGLNDLAIVYEELGQYGPAEKLLRQSLELRKQTLGEKHPTYAAGLINLSLLYFRQGEYQSAEPLCQQALEIKRQLVDDTAVVLSERQQLAMAGSLAGPWIVISPWRSRRSCRRRTRIAMYWRGRAACLLANTERDWDVIKPRTATRSRSWSRCRDVSPHWSSPCRRPLARKPGAAR